MNCEICNNEEIIETLHIGLDLGFHIGNYNKKPYQEFYKEEPKTMSVTSIYCCRKCYTKIVNSDWLFLAESEITKKLKQIIVKDLIKKEILERLE